MIAESIDESNKALSEHLEHANSLTAMINDQDEGPVKAELLKVLGQANTHIKDLETHIKTGSELIQEKEQKLSAVQKKIGHKLDEKIHLK